MHKSKSVRSEKKKEKNCKKCMSKLESNKAKTAAKNTIDTSPDIKDTDYSNIFK